MFKKVLFALYTPMFSVLLILAAMLFAFNTNYEIIRGDAGSILTSTVSKVLSQELMATNISFEDVKAACSLNVAEVPQQYEFIKDVCADIRAGKIDSLDEAQESVISKGKETVLSELDRAKQDMDVVSMLFYVLAIAGYFLYLLMIFFSRKEGIVFYGAVVLLTLLLLLWTIDLLERAAVGAISNELLNNLEPKYRDPALEMLKDFRDRIIPAIKGEGYNITALLLSAPIAVWAVHRLTFGVKK